MLAPLHKLLRKEAEWKWSMECKHAFNESKQLLVNNNLLVHFNPKRPIIIACDASPIGVGAILSIICENGQERPCSMASSTLTSAEKNYSQLHREALAVVFAIKRFHKYVYGYPFVVYTDHKPLEILLGDKKSLGIVSSVRLHRWILLLANYQYTIKYRKILKKIFRLTSG